MKSLIPVAVLTFSLSSITQPLCAASVIARVGETEVSYDEVKPILDSLPEADREALAKNPALLSQTVRTIIIQQMLLKEALKTGWDKKPEVVAQLNRLRDNAIAESYLQSISQLPEGYPSTAEVEAVYEARKAELQVPKQYKLAQIYIAAPEGGDKAAEEKVKAKVDAVQKALKQAGADFGAIAKENSEEKESAAKGGEIGWLAEASIQPEIRSRVTALAEGSTTEVVRLKDGYYVVKLLDIQEPRTAKLEEVRDQLIRAMRTERARINREAALSKLQQQNPIALDELTLGKLVAPPKKP